MTNLFGEEELDVTHSILRQKFIEPPFSILDTRQAGWQERKRTWKQLGIRPEIVNNNNTKTFNISEWASEKADKDMPSISIFDPALCEVMYKWFCPDGGLILDPFAGGAVRGIVANFMGYHYTGIDIRQEQIDDNRSQALDILPVNNQPQYYVGDSDKVLGDWIVDCEDWEEPCGHYDFVFSCPPYADLEVYSDLEGDISNMKYDDFLNAYRSIIAKACFLLKPGGMAAFVVGEVRDKKGNFYGLVPDTIKAFRDAGMAFYNEIIMVTPTGTAAIRAGGMMKNKKIVRTHQNILVFIK